MKVLEEIIDKLTEIQQLLALLNTRICVISNLEKPVEPEKKKKLFVPITEEDYD